MDISQTSPSKRSSIPIPRRKTSLHLYISGGGGSSSNSSSNVGSASASINDDEPSFTRSMLGSFAPPPPETEPTAGASTPSDYVQLKESHNRLIESFEKLTKRNEHLEHANEQLNHNVRQLIATLEGSKRELAAFTEKNRRLRRKLSEIIPAATLGGESTVDGAESDDEPVAEVNAVLSPVPTVAEGRTAGSGAKAVEVDDEMEKLKSYLNNLELQQYEANEKISELLESKQQQEEEMKKLRDENVELNKVARLMSRNMLESIDTSKRLENSFIQVQRERDHLARQNRDSVDAKTTTNEEIQMMRSEIELQRKTYEAQFIEYKSLMSEEHERKTNDQIVGLELEVERLRQQLDEALARAERAEEEVQTLRQQLRVSRLQELRQDRVPEVLDCENPMVSMMSLCSVTGPRTPAGSSLSSHAAPAPALLPPPPPPPLPPPPPPPPLPANNFANSKHLIPAGESGTEQQVLGLSEAISKQKLNHVAITNVNSPHAATGLDSVIADIKSGKVTLRRRRPNIPAATNDAGGSSSNSIRESQRNYNDMVARNPALQEMYEVLERMKRRNRKSKIIVESELGSRGTQDTDQQDGVDGPKGTRRFRTVMDVVADL
ncbi:shootin-1-like [Anopheles ziemanni]|uniref:shootin-1-like n=1 Tax=Anopheles coustani TaxID=139045 RepID=UPI0026583125|nr:shootin-1-like [Anopheles coustani]XP_058172166.1 shootin-1-like [Anopheles ziemanni]